MTEPSLHFVDCPAPQGSHRMAYWQWGDAQAAHTVVCVHGLSRQGRDFDVLAQALLARTGGALRVVCPDVVGRGRSDWLSEPMAYQIPTYAADMLALLKTLQPQTLDWVGTSMGGLIGMAVCAHAPALGLPVRKLVLNDVGPAVQWESIVRIAGYLGRHMEFPSLSAALDAMWQIASSFGPHTPQQWQDFNRAMFKPAAHSADGQGVVLHYDPAIAVPVRAMTQEQAAQAEALVWQLYDSIQAQTLLLRGAESDLLSAATAQAMTQRGPRARLIEFAGVGHAPTLLAHDQVQAVCSFLLD